MNIKTTLLLVGLLGVVALLLLVFTPADQVQAKPLSVTPPAQSLGIALGIYQPPTPSYAQELTNVFTLTKKHGIAMYYWYWNLGFDAYLPNQVQTMPAADRPIIMIAWGPADGKQSLGCNQDYPNAVPWSSISSGLCDTYITNFALAMKARSPERFLIKFAHEMNGGGTPWSPINIGGPNPGGFVAAWRRVRNIFKINGVANVEFVWAPIFSSYPHTPENDIHLYYPGDSYVDWVGPSGFNYYTNFSLPWWTFDYMFDSVLRDFSCLYAKPQIIHEFATVPGDGNSPQSKEQWIADAYLKAQNYIFLRGVVWFNDLDPGYSADFRITTSTYRDGSVQSLPGGTGTWTDAYKNAVASAAYTSTLPSLAAATPSSTTCLKIYLPIIIK